MYGKHLYLISYLRVEKVGANYTAYGWHECTEWYLRTKLNQNSLLCCKIYVLWFILMSTCWHVTINVWEKNALEEVGIPRKNHGHVASHWQTLSHGGNI